MTAEVPERVEPVDPFDLPESLGAGPVTWTPDRGLGTGHLVRGVLRPADGEPVACDLLAVDQAYPVPVAHDDVRSAAHQAWRHGQVHLVRLEDRLTLAVPGTGFDPAGVLDTLARLTKALGAAPGDWLACLRLG